MSQPGLEDVEKTSYNGTRKLIRPTLPIGGERRREHTDDPLTHALNAEHHSIESTHAEAFYFQKQIQIQTEMIIVLDDGEQLSGVIEWYDRCVIKLRAARRQRILIYKSSIKYLYKTSDLNAQTSA